MNNLIKLAKEEGGYQPIDIKGVRVFQGWRDCDERWEILKPYLKIGDSYIDIGSHYGFFENKLSPSPILSFEAGSKRAEIQKQMLELNDFKNVYLCQAKVTPSLLESISKVVEGFDCILALAVLHYFTPEDFEKMIKLFSVLSPKLIIEHPNKNESAPQKEWTKQKDVLKTLKENYSTVVKIGEVKMNDGTRDIYCCNNDKLERKDLLSHFWGKKTHNLKYAGGWLMDDRKIESGFNLATPIRFNLIYPNFIDELADTYFKLKEQELITDISVYNVINTVHGLKIIDFKEMTDDVKIYNTHRDVYITDLKKMTKEQIKSFLLRYKQWQNK